MTFHLKYFGHSYHFLCATSDQVGVSISKIQILNSEQGSGSQTFSVAILGHETTSHASTNKVLVIESQWYGTTNFKMVRVT